MSVCVPDTSGVQAAVARLRAGGLVAFPTETVYGLGAAARQADAVRGIFAAKGRPADHPVIVHLASAAQVFDWARIPAHHAAAFDALASAYWPGPLTLVLPRADSVLDVVTGGRSTVGLRVPAHPVAQALLRAFGDGIAAPSANRFGRVSPTTAAHVYDELGDAVLVLDGGPTTVGVESTIVDFSGPHAALLRPGGVSRAEVEACVGELGVTQTVAPGTLPAHYAPSAGVLVSDDPHIDAERLRAQGHRVAVLLAGDPDDHARRLYRELRAADAAGATVVVAERPQAGGLADAIADRLQRAAVGSPVRTVRSPK